MHGFYGYGLMSGGGIFMGIFWLLIIVVVLYFVFRNNNNSGNNHNSFNKNSTNEALRILNEKYVNGEISEEEYKHKKKNLLN